MRGLPSRRMCRSRQNCQTSERFWGSWRAGRGPTRRRKRRKSGHALFLDRILLDQTCNKFKSCTTLKSNPITYTKTFFFIFFDDISFIERLCCFRDEENKLTFFPSFISNTQNPLISTDFYLHYCIRITFTHPPIYIEPSIQSNPMLLILTYRKIQSLEAQPLQLTLILCPLYPI